MKIKQFLAYSIIFITIVGVFVFVDNSGSYSLDLPFLSLQLPIAIWFILPAFILMILAILHMAYYGMGFFWTKRNFKIDSDLYDEVAKETLLGFESNKEFKTDIFKNAVEITKFLSIYGPKYMPNVNNEALVNIVKIITSVNNGEVVDLKRYKLPPTSKLYEQNEINRVNSDYKNCFNMLKDKKIMANANLKDIIRDAIIKNASFLEIKKFGFNESKDDIVTIINRFCDDDNFEIAKEELMGMILKFDFSSKEYVRFAKRLKNKIIPEHLVAIFDRIRSYKDEATEAYLFILYEVGMIQEIREILNFSNEKFDKIETLLFLKDNGRNFPVSYLY